MEQSNAGTSTLRPQPAGRDGLLKRLADGPVICAEGYLFEFERRGYLQAGAFVPGVVLEHPELVEMLHRDFVHAGSDVVEAFTYYAHREKMKIIGREGDLERINQQALRIAKTVSYETGALFAGNLCNTSVYNPADPDTHTAARLLGSGGYDVDRTAEAFRAHAIRQPDEKDFARLQIRRNLVLVRIAVGECELEPATGNGDGAAIGERHLLVAVGVVVVGQAACHLVRIDLSLAALQQPDRAGRRRDKGLARIGHTALDRLVNHGRAQVGKAAASVGAG